MTERDTFVRHIIDVPADDTPRLVFADWLTDHGEGDRAEFIRVQCELAREEGHGHGVTRPHGGSCDTCEHLARLGRRERELFENGHTARWGFPRNIPATPFPDEYAKGPPGGGPRGLITRGFVSHITLALAAFCGGPCGSCEGGKIYLYHDGVIVGGGSNCSRCKGSGTLPGVAAAVFAAQPVTGVRLSDRDPAETHLRNTKRPWAWIREDPRRPGATNPAYLPAILHDLLSDYSDESAQGIRFYPTRELAHAALSDDCVAYGRSVVPTTHPCPACASCVMGPCLACGGRGQLPGLPPLPRGASA